MTGGQVRSIVKVMRERDALKARVAELEKERDEARRHDIRSKMCMGVGDGSGQLFVYGDYESIKAAQAKLIGLQRERAEYFDKLYGTPCEQIRHAQEIEELASALDASRRQVEGLREDLERIHSAADEGSYRGCPHCLQVMGMIDDALSALDAPQPDQRDAIIAEAVELLRPFSGGEFSYSSMSAARAFVEKHGALILTELDE